MEGRLITRDDIPKRRYAMERYSEIMRQYNELGEYQALEVKTTSRNQCNALSLFLRRKSIPHCTRKRGDAIFIYITKPEKK